MVPRIAFSFPPPPPPPTHTHLLPVVLAIWCCSTRCRCWSTSSVTCSQPNNLTAKLQQLRRQSLQSPPPRLCSQRSQRVLMEETPPIHGSVTDTHQGAILWAVNKMGLQAVFYLDQSLVLKTLDGVLFSVIFNACIYWSTRLTHLSWSLTQYWDHSITTIITLHVTLFKYELSSCWGWV